MSKEGGGGERGERRKHVTKIMIMKMNNSDNNIKFLSLFHCQKTSHTKIICSK